jgi:hypothetical protein
MKLIYIINTFVFYYLVLSYVIVYSSLDHLFRNTEYSFINFYLPLLLTTIGVSTYSFQLLTFYPRNKKDQVYNVLYAVMYVGLFLSVWNYPTFKNIFTNPITSLVVSIAIGGALIESLYYFKGYAPNTAPNVNRG